MNFFSSKMAKNCFFVTFLVFESPDDFLKNFFFPGFALWKRLILFFEFQTRGKSRMVDLVPCWSLELVQLKWTSQKPLINSSGIKTCKIQLPTCQINLSNRFWWTSQKPLMFWLGFKAMFGWPWLIILFYSTKSVFYLRITIN